MQLERHWEVLRQYWHEKIAVYWQNFRRLDTASRPAAFGVLATGAVLGFVPLAVMIVMFRLVDAVTSARAVRVLTSDLNSSLIMLVVVWVFAIGALLITRTLQGLTRRIVDRTASVVFMTSVVIALLVVMPFRALLLLAIPATLYPWIQNTRVRFGCMILHALLSLWMVSTVTSFLLSRSVTVGSYLLFLGAIFGALTMTIFYAAAPRTV